MFSETETRSQTLTNDELTKKYFRDHKLSGIFKDVDPFTGELREEGRFERGKEVGQWREIDQDGDIQIFEYREERVGAICRDGWISNSTGRGTCSHHGGVGQWLYMNQKYFVSGTGKYEPKPIKAQRLKGLVKTHFNIAGGGIDTEITLSQAILQQIQEMAKMKLEMEALRAELSTIKQKKNEPLILKSDHQKQQQKVKDAEEADGEQDESVASVTEEYQSEYSAQKVDVQVDKKDCDFNQCNALQIQLERLCIKDDNSELVKDMSQKDFESDVSLDEKYILKNKSNPEANDDSIKQGVEVLSYSESQEELVQKGCLASKISTEVSSLLNIMDLSRKAEDQSQSS